MSDSVGGVGAHREVPVSQPAIGVTVRILCGTMSLLFIIAPLTAARHVPLAAIILLLEVGSVFLGLAAFGGRIPSPFPAPPPTRQASDLLIPSRRVRVV